MKLCFSTLVCPAWSLEQIVAAGPPAGIEGVDFRGLGEEIDITKLRAFNQHLDATLKLLSWHGLSMPCLNLSVTLISPAPQRWQQMLEEFHRAAQLASRTGSTRFFRIFGGAVPKDMSRDEGRAMAQRRLRQLVKIAHQSGAQVLLETHDDWATSQHVRELLHEFDPAEAGVLWDIEHPYRRGETPVDTVTALRRYIKHVHVKDSVRVEAKSRPRLLGDGDLPIADCIRALREIGYDGWLCLETEKRWHAEAPEPEVSVPQFASFMNALASQS